MTEEGNSNEGEQKPAEERVASRSPGSSWSSLGKVFAVVFVAALIGSFGGVYGGSLLGGMSVTGDAAAKTTQDIQPTTSPPSNPPPAADTVDIVQLLDDDPVKGDLNAPVTIVEFSDFQCPFCGRFYSSSLPGIKTDYIDTGKVKLVYRDFPLSLHPNAQPAAEAAECANEQGKFWEFHDKIFQNQAAMSTASYKQWAGEMGLDQAQFNSCVDSRKYQAEVQADFAAGSQVGVSRTPSFFIGPSDGKGQKIVGACPLTAFEAAIGAELEGKSWTSAPGCIIQVA